MTYSHSRLEPRHPAFPVTHSWGQVRSLLSGFRENEALMLARQYDPPDARNVALTNIAMIVGASCAVISVIDNCRLVPEDDFNNLFGLIGADRQTVADELDKYLRISMLTLAQFQIEHLLKVLMIGDGIEHPPRAFSQLSRRCLEHFKYPSVDRAVKVLSVAAQIRNSLHNNGIHENDDLRVQVNGYVYVLRRGRRCDQATWAHLVHILRAELRIIERLLDLSKVRAMGFVHEPYSQAIEAGT